MSGQIEHVADIACTVGMAALGQLHDISSLDSVRTRVTAQRSVVLRKG
jgi:hypothetical protein